jgi:enoyl-CoA hydratase
MSVFLTTKSASITTKHLTRLLLPFSLQSNVNQYQYTFFSTINYEIKNRLAYITLNRPKVMNSINDEMPKELSECVEKANNDPSVHIIVLSGAGKAFCSGYDLSYYAQNKNEYAVQEMPWDSMKDYTYMKRNTEYFMSLFRSPKPTLCKINGDALAGGSDIALCCDIIIMANEAQIGYMPARVWGCPTTAMWIYR